MNRLRDKLSYANVIATLALFFALGGVAAAAGIPVMRGQRLLPRCIVCKDKDDARDARKDNKQRSAPRRPFAPHT